MQMDQAVLEAYGWHQASESGPAIDLRHDFYEVDFLPENDRIRYTIHPDARREILKRLLLLNHRRYEEEERQGLHAKKTGKKKTPAGPSVGQGAFDLENEANQKREVLITFTLDDTYQ